MFQGLSDPEEFVVHKTLGALTALTELGLIQKSMLQEFLQEVVPFLAHPVSVWLTLYHSSVYDTPVLVFGTAVVHIRVCDKPCKSGIFYI